MVMFSARRSRRAAAWRAFTGLVMLALALTGLIIAPGHALAETSGATQMRTVSAQSGWQESYMTLSAGQQFTVTFLSGSWTVDAKSLPLVGPEGYSEQADSAIYQGCKYDASNRYGVLYGQVNGEAADNAFPIGNGGTFTASRDGELYLRINDTDQCLGDNEGSVTVEIQASASSQGNDGAFFRWLSACVDGQLGDGCKNDAEGIARVSTDPPNLAHCAEQGAEIASEGKVTFDGAYTCLGVVAGGLKQYWEQHGSK
jgi:hypothetical protein